MNTRALALMVAATLAMGCATYLPRQPEHFVFAAAGTADVITTHQALNRGATEANPLMPEWTPALAGAKVGGWFLTRWIELKLIRQLEDLGLEYRWWHRLFVWAPASVLWSWAAVHNHGIAR